MTLFDKFFWWLFVRRRVAKLESNLYTMNADTLSNEAAFADLIGKLQRQVDNLQRYAERISEDLTVCEKQIDALKPKPKRKYKKRTKAKYRKPRPSKEVLAELLWSMPSTAIANNYGVSDKCIEKWAVHYGLDKPPRGYWATLAAGNKPDKDDDPGINFPECDGQPVEVKIVENYEAYQTVDNLSGFLKENEGDK